MLQEDSGRKLRASVSSLIPKRDKVKLLADGRLYVKYKTEVDIYEGGFCLENFVDLKNQFSAMSAFINTPFTPLLTLKLSTDKKVYIMTLIKLFITEQNPHK
jgi:hypothetical protein